MNEKELKKLLENLLKKANASMLSLKKIIIYLKINLIFLNIIQLFQTLQRWWEKILAI